MAAEDVAEHLLRVRPQRPVPLHVRPLPVAAEPVAVVARAVEVVHAVAHVAAAADDDSRFVNTEKVHKDVNLFLPIPRGQCAIVLALGNEGRE